MAREPNFGGYMPNLIGIPRLPFVQSQASHKPRVLRLFSRARPSFLDIRTISARRQLLILFSRTSE